MALTSIHTVTVCEAPWERFYERWRRLEPPLRPHSDVCVTMRRLIGGRTHALLLGATPELADIAPHTVAVERSATTLDIIWPGNTEARRAINGNWLSLPCSTQSFEMVLGDGSFNCLEYPAGYLRVFAELVRVVRPGGRIVVRVYLTPEPCESLLATRQRTLAGGVGRIHALKWRVANAVCAATGEPNVAVTAILEAFNRTFPNRAALRRATGWSDEDVAQVDAYAEMPDVFSFPTACELMAVASRFGRCQLVDAGSYELAERCPLLVMDLD